MADAGVKRKRPPTFRHLPIDRAKKVKQIWVENVKIKSKWKAQKRKELQSSSISAQRNTQDDNTKEDDDSESGAEESNAEQEEDLVRGEIVPSLKKSAVHPSRAHKIPGQPPLLNNRQDDINKTSSSEQTSSLRDLTRKAYSRSSLHSFKSDPLNRRRGAAVRGGRGDERGAEWGRGRRGQPNMKLRMDAMLEKIKRDFV